MGMSAPTYQKHNDIVCDAIQDSVVEVMKKAAKKEAAYAIPNNSVDKNGIPKITVVADGCWSKRSYKMKYNALSGCAAIVGQQFGEVLYLGVKNKFCSVCARAESKGTRKPIHTCYKNYEGNSTGMESKILAEGFKQSKEMYGIKYATFIAEDDSSTYN